MRTRTLWIPLAACSLGIGCTSILGDFTQGSGGSQDGGDSGTHDVQPGTDSPGETSGGCGGGMHVCSGSCVPNDIHACGATCEACPVPSGGSATCDGTSCSVSYSGSETMCGDKCVDTSTSSGNCGGCGMACAGTCTLSKCLLTLASTQSSPFDITIDATNVYWTNQGTLASDYADGSVMGVPIGGGTLTMYAADLHLPYGIDHDALNLYWANMQGDTVVICPIAGCGENPDVMAGGIGLPAFVAVADGYVFWGDQADNSIYSCSTTPPDYCENMPEAVADGAPQVDNPAGLTVDENIVYWANNVAGSSGAIMSVVLGVGATNPVASTQSGPTFLSRDATNLYWTTTDGGTVVQTAIAGGTILTLATGQSSPTGIAVDAKNVYWANNGSNEILSVPIGGGAIVTLATGQLQPQAVAVDTKNLYWANSDSVAGGANGSVMQLELTK